MNLEFGPDSQDCLEDDEAWLYCATLTHDNKYDWFLFPLPIKRTFDGTAIVAIATPVRFNDA